MAASTFGGITCAGLALIISLAASTAFSSLTAKSSALRRAIAWSFGFSNASAAMAEAATVELSWMLLRIWGSHRSRRGPRARWSKNTNVQYCATRNIEAKIYPPPCV